MISPIKLTPQMDYNTLVSAINNTLMQIEQENRVKAIRDADGKNRMVIGQWDANQYGILASDANGVRRILIGQNPKTGTTGIWVSKPTIDVVNELMA